MKGFMKSIERDELLDNLRRISCLAGVAMGGSCMNTLQTSSQLLKDIKLLFKSTELLIVNQFKENRKMAKNREITPATVKRIKILLRTNTYTETAKILAKDGFKTPRGKKPSEWFINYVASAYL